MQTLEAGARFGPYVIEGFVAGGGMGRVYAGAHHVYGQPVALKVLHERFLADPRWHRRFSEEGLLGMRLKHPHVLAARDLVDNDGKLALVMDLVRGGQTLLGLMERDWPTGLPLVDALTVFLRVVSGVEYLHERGVIHGDLKPENVLVEGELRTPRAWAPRVTDFGTVALIADPVTIDGRAAVVASPRYASPEHLLGIDQLDKRSDIYGLGLLLHWLVSGRHASGARSVEEAADVVHQTTDLTRIVDQPEPVLALIRTATAPDPDDRPADCRAMAIAIRELLDELGMGLDLEDLQAELATETLPERAAAQKALQEARDEPPPSHEDTEIALERPIGPDPTVPSTPPVIASDSPLPTRPPEQVEPREASDSAASDAGPPPDQRGAADDAVPDTEAPIEDAPDAADDAAPDTGAPIEDAPDAADDAAPDPAAPSHADHVTQHAHEHDIDPESDSATEDLTDDAPATPKTGSAPHPPRDTADRFTGQADAVTPGPATSAPSPSATSAPASDDDGPKAPPPIVPVEPPETSGGGARSVALLLALGLALGLVTALALWVAGVIGA